MTFKWEVHKDVKGVILMPLPPKTFGAGGICFWVCPSVSEAVSLSVYENFVNTYVSTRA